MIAQLLYMLKYLENGGKQDMVMTQDVAGGKIFIHLLCSFFGVSYGYIIKVRVNRS